ncbi:MAG: branched-chain amino acid ABC transporter permease [Pseudomonadota bacterium]
MTDKNLSINMVTTPISQTSRWAEVDRATLLVIALLALAPLIAPEHFLSELTRTAIYGLAACAVGFAIRHGRMVSFGHAAFFGLGAYAVLIARNLGLEDAIAVVPFALILVAIVALGIGFLSLRTRGVAFIMITLGFAQMVFFIISSMQSLGASDGLALVGRNTLFGLSTESTITFHYITLAVLILGLMVMMRISASPAGMALKGIAADERRLRALGFASQQLLLSTFVLSAVLTGFAGVLTANFYYFVSPAYLHWLVSGELLVMIAIGGIATLSGGLYGAIVLIIAEAILSQYTSYWRILLGPAVILSVLYLRNGLHPAINRLLGGKS